MIKYLKNRNKIFIKKFHSNSKLFSNSHNLRNFSQDNSDIQKKLFADTPKIDDIPNLRHFLTDNFGRMHNYLRISLTERCNLRCQVKIIF
jgi:hypothetical protein